MFPQPVPTSDTPAPGAVAGTRLCTACALCCDGTLFARVPLSDGDALPDALPARQGAGGGRHLAQPCAALGGTACRCYAQRPQACRGYRCALLAAVECDETSLDEALAVVARARQLDRSTEASRYLAFHFGRR